MESYCNKNVPGSRSCRSVNDRSSCNSVSCGNDNRMYNRGRQMTNGNRAMLHQEKMTQQCRKEGMVREGCARDNNIKRNEREERSRGRNVEIECVCQVASVADCHRHDEMEHLGCEFPVVMAYVPWQQWGDLYDADCGLMQGTIFKDLNFIFCGERC